MKRGWAILLMHMSEGHIVYTEEVFPPRADPGRMAEPARLCPSRTRAGQGAPARELFLQSVSTSILHIFSLRLISQG